jgi:hypothetical protein
MSAANEPIIYAGAMIISVVLMVIATSFSGAMLDQAYGLMELNHLRYQSAVATHDVAVQERGYAISESEFWNKVDTTGSEYCVFQDSEEFSYLGSNPAHVNFTEMRVKWSYNSDCTIDPDNLQGDTLGETIDTFKNLSTYPTLYSAVDANSEGIITLPATLWD